MARMTPGKMAKARGWHTSQAERFRQRGEDSRADEQARYAAKYSDTLRSCGRCQMCGKTLSDPVSVERGIGPDCWQQVA